MKTPFIEQFRTRIFYLLTLLFTSAAFLQAQNTLTLTFVESDYNGYNISCPGGSDGSIDMTIANGTAPYTILWSTKATTEDIDSLVAGYYRVTVTDSQGERGEGELTLDEPGEMSVSLTPFEYPNEYHVSCYECFNGSIETDVVGGVSPYTFEWSDGAVTEDRSILGARDYSVTVTDANNCALESERIELRQPDRNDWTMFGNAGSVPGYHYFGTSDQKDLVFKTHSVERLRLLSDGRIKVNDVSLNGSALYVDSLGILKSGAPPLDPVLPLPDPDDCALWNPSNFPYWRSDGNYFPHPLCPGEEGPLLGTRSPHDLVFITEDQQQMWLTVEGKLGIGIVPPSGPIQDFRLYVEDGIVTREVKVQIDPFQDYVFEEGYELMSLDELQAYIDEHGHLPGIMSAEEVTANGGVGIADLQGRMLQTIEEQALYILELKEMLEQLKAELVEVRALVEPK